MTRRMNNCPVEDEALRLALEHAGWRYTRQRAAVHAYLRSVEFHPTAEQVFAAVRRCLPNISLATVYKALEALVDAHLAARVADGFTHVAFGDLFLEDVRAYRETKLAGSGLTALFPLWRIADTAELARTMIAGGLEARLTCVDPRALAPDFAGRRFDLALLADLPPGVDPCGERGEFHSFAYAGPMFAEPIAVAPGERVERGGFVFCDLVADRNQEMEPGTRN